MRTDDATHVFGVRINVWMSILVFLGAVAYFVLARRRGDREVLASDRVAQDEGDGGHARTSDQDGEDEQDSRPGGEASSTAEEHQRR